MDTHGWIHLIHLFIFGTLFLYVGIKRTTICPWMFHVLLALGILVWGYHIFKTYVKYVDGKNPWVNLLHIFAVAPVLTYIGYYKTETPRFVFEILLMLGFAVAGYHGTYMLEDFRIIQL